MAINNRYDFVMLFDVEMEIQTETRTQAMLPAWMQNQVMDMLPMSALKGKFGIM